MSYTARDSKIGFGCVGQPRHLNPLASPNPFRLGCFIAGFAWLKWRVCSALKKPEPPGFFKFPQPCHLPIFESRAVYGGYPDLSGVKKILVVKLRHLGDVLLAGPVFSALKEAFPRAEIDAYVYKEAVPMLDGHPAIGRLIAYDRGWKKLGLLSRLAKEAVLLREIRCGGYDLAVNLTEGDRGVLAAFASKAKVRAGFKPKGGWQRKVLTHIAKDCPSLRHTVERNLDVLRRIGIFPSPEAKELSFHIPNSSIEKARALSSGEPFVLIHPTSRWRFKCWPSAKMRELASQLLLEGRKVILTSGPDTAEQEMAREICQGLDILNLAGQLSLKDLGALIALSDVLVCVDSVPFHMASALKKPVAALFGPTSDATWGPWRNPHARILAQPFSCRPCYLDGCGGSKRSECLETLPVAAVLQTVHSLLAARQMASL